MIRTKIPARRIPLSFRKSVYENLIKVNLSSRETEFLSCSSIS